MSGAPPDEVKRRPAGDRAAHPNHQPDIEGSPAGVPLTSGNDLHIPAELPADVIGAALAYAKAGWYVGPLEPGSKDPGSILRKGWPDKTSRDPQVIASWFAGTDRGLFLDMGRSGAVAFDVDHQDRLPDDLREALKATTAPFQSTRVNEDGRGHFVYRVDRPVGNSTAAFPGGWGEIRSHHAVIVVEPTVHADEAAGGRYSWERTGPVPPLPSVLAERLSEPTVASSDVDAIPLIKDLPGAELPMCRHMLEKLADDLAGFPPEGRHDHMKDSQVRLIGRAEEGHHGVVLALSKLKKAFLSAVSLDRANLAEGEWNRALEGAPKRVQRGWRPETDPCALRYDREHWPNTEQLMRGLPGTDRLSSSGLPIKPEPAGSPTTEADRAPAADTAGAAANVRPLALAQLTRYLETDDPPERYLIDRLLPAGGNALLVAQFKAGKSTAVANLARSLVDGTPFLGEFAVRPFAGSVVIIDDELSEAQFRRVLRAQGIVDTDRVYVISLRGRAGAFDLRDPLVLLRWVEMLRAVDCKVLIFDCLRPVLDALGLSEDKDAGRFLVLFDRLLLDAEVEASTVVHHMGHVGERGRGDSRLRDWPDVEWKIVRQVGKDDNGRDVDDPAAPRFFSAFGRDIEVPEGALEFDPLTKHLTYSGVSRKQSNGRSLVIPVLQYLKEKGLPTSKNELENCVADGKHVRAIRDGIKVGQNNGWISGGAAGSGHSAGLVLTQSGHAYLTTSTTSTDFDGRTTQEPRHLVSIDEVEVRSEGGPLYVAPTASRSEEQLTLPTPDDQEPAGTDEATTNANQEE